jgi:hypothetical protein
MQRTKSTDPGVVEAERILRRISTLPLAVARKVTDGVVDQGFQCYKCRKSFCYLGLNEVILPWVVNKYKTYPDSCADKFSRQDREVKRETIITQGGILAEHAKERGIILRELSVAGEPENHLKSCVSVELVSYETYKPRWRRQTAGAPYKHSTCKKQRYYFGNVVDAVLEQWHPQCNFFNSDTMGAMTKTKEPFFASQIVAFMGDGTRPLYYRTAHVVGGLHARRPWEEDKKYTRRTCDSMLEKLGFVPIEPWFTYPTQSHHGLILTRTFFYKPSKRIANILALQRRVVQTLNES